MTRAAAVLSLFIAVFCSLISLAHAEDGGARVILVLDASGSMRAKINGKAKIDIAKEVVGKIVAGWKPADELGLVVYGHRKKGECSDIETVIAPGPVDAGAYMGAVNGIQPKGQTPMTEAVKQAAEALQYTEKKATVILVSDGIENCNADPCAVAAELAKAGVDLKVHTVGFGLDDKGAVAQLKCLAEKTGGTFTIANNADDLLKALTKTVAAKPAPFNVTGHATLAGGVEIPRPFSPPNWVFRRPDAADGTPGEMVETTNADQLKFHLEPGDYVLRLEAGVAAVEQPFTLAPGKTVDLKPVLNAGIVNFSAMIDDKTKLSDPGAAWEVVTPEGGSVEAEYGPTRSFLLNAGSYQLRLSLGETKVETPFEIKAGETRDMVIAFGSGKLVAQAVFAEGGPAMDKGMAFEVARPVEGQDQPQWLNTKYDAKSVFTLPAGKYRLAVSLGLARSEQDVDVKTGQETVVTLNAKAGFIAASATGATSYVVSEGKAGIDGQRKWLTTSYDPTLNIAANEGSYWVQAFKGDALIGEKEVTVAAGQRGAITLP